MRVIDARNVCDAWHQGVHLLRDGGLLEDSRAGRVLVYPEPVCTVYRRPSERVLFCPARRANPFFHLFESMWMLAGRQDATWLDQFVHDFSSRFAEDDGRQHGAYGHRWRHQWGMDQLELITGILRADPTSRQAVLQMWDPAVDLGAQVRDKPCNSTVFFRTRQSMHHPEQRLLDMTVLCRSNDIVWGAYGANAVHFSVLQEYMAAMCGMRLGVMWQVSNNWHAYTDVFDRILRRGVEPCDLYAGAQSSTSPLFDPRTVSVLYDDLRRWMRDPAREQRYQNWELFEKLLIPMFRAHRSGQWTDEIGPPDWRLAAQHWLQARRQR